MKKQYLECLRLASGIVAKYRDKYHAAADAVAKGDSPPDPPPAPDYSAANREAVFADIESLPARKEIEAAAKMGGAGSVTFGGRTMRYDFRGISDLDQQTTELQARRQSSDAMAEMALDIQRKYGNQFVDQALQQIERSDPVGAEVRKKLASKTLEQLEAGMSLTDEEQRFAQQAFRRASAARGGPMLGDAPAISEAFAEFGVGRNLLGQRMNMAARYVGMPQTAQFGQASGAQGGAAMFAPSGLGAGIGINPNAGAMGTQFAANVYGTQANIFGTQSKNWMYQRENDPWGNILGGLSGMGLQAAGGMAGGALQAAGGAIAGPLGSILGAGATALLGKK